MITNHPFNDIILILLYSVEPNVFIGEMGGKLWKKERYQKERDGNQDEQIRACFAYESRYRYGGTL